MRLNPIWEPGSTPADVDEVARPWLVHRDGLGWDLLYAGRCGQTWRVCRASAPGPEPRDFRVLGPPLEPGPPGSGEEGGVRSPCAVVTDDGGLLVVYAGCAEPGGRRALFSAWAPAPEQGAGRWAAAGGLAVAGLPPVLAWQRLGSTLAPGEPGDADAGGCDHPSLLRIGRGRWLWYTADDGLRQGARIAAASSAPGVDWRRHGVVLGRGAPGQPDEDGAEAPCVSLGAAGRLDLLYTGRGRAGARILRARSADGVTFDRLGPVAEVGTQDASLSEGPDGRRWLAALVDGRVVVGAVPM